MAEALDRERVHALQLRGRPAVHISLFSCKHGFVNFINYQRVNRIKEVRFILIDITISHRFLPNTPVQNRKNESVLNINIADKHEMCTFLN